MGPRMSGVEEEDREVYDRVDEWGELYGCEGCVWIEEIVCSPIVLFLYMWNLLIDARGIRPGEPGRWFTQKSGPLVKSSVDARRSVT